MCTSPLIRYRYKYRIDNFIIPYTETFQLFSQKSLELLFPNFSSFLSYCERYLDYQIVPCRKCDECKAKYAQDWAIRCYHEFLMRESACFVTLTVDDIHATALLDSIRKSYKKGANTYCNRCIKGSRWFRYPLNYSLNKHFLLDWLKKFRDNLYKNIGVKIRYFGCGEYGDNNERPHYHLIIFGYDFPDKQFFRKSSKNVDLYLSEELSHYWPYGMATIQSVNYKACMYTAKYCTKKLKFDNAESEYEYYYGRQPEFLFMSKGNCQSNRCPYIDEITKERKLNSLRNLTNEYCKFCDKTRGGLGYDWLLKYHFEVLKLGYILIDGIKYSIPDYYHKILQLTFPEEYANYKLSSLLRADEKFNERPLEGSAERLSAKAKVKRGKIKFYQRNLSDLK